MKGAIVVGASSGVGRELAKVLVENGYKVGITARRNHLLKELAAEKPDSYAVKSFDILKSETILPNLEGLANELSSLDLVVICAGIIQYDVELDYTIEFNTNAVNVTGFTLISDWAFNHFRKQGHGHLVGITSVAGLRGWRNNPAYNASKAYEINYLEGLRNLAHYIKLPITVTNIIPGYMETQMKGKTLVFWVCKPEEAAQMIYKDIKRKRKTAYVYRRWRIGAFIYKHIPNKLIEIM